MNSELFALSTNATADTLQETFQTTSTHQTNVVVAKKVLRQGRKRHSEQKPSSRKETAGETYANRCGKRHGKFSGKGRFLLWMPKTLTVPKRRTLYRKNSPTIVRITAGERSGKNNRETATLQWR